MKVLFVCLGNICRSPTAEAVMRELIQTHSVDMQIDSAGTAAYHIGKSPDPRSQQAALKRGIVMDDLRARKVSQEDFKQFDYILAMDQANYQDLLAVKPNDASAKVELFLKEYGTLDKKDVPDPYYGGEQGFEMVLDLLEDGCRGFLVRHGKL